MRAWLEKHASQINNLVRVILEGGSSIATSAYWLVSIIRSISALTTADGEEYSPPAVELGALAIFAILGVLDAYVHYITYENDRYKDQTPETTPLAAETPKNGDSLPELSNVYKFLAYICALDCSIDTASIPTTIYGLLTAFNVVGNPKSMLQHGLLLGSTAVSSFFAGITSTSQLNMARKHLQEHLAKINNSSSRGG